MADFKDVVKSLKDNKTSQDDGFNRLEAAVKGGDLTKAGIRRAAENVNVDSDGMMPVRTLGVSKAETSTSITAPDASIASGTRLVKANYSGPTAASHDWSKPCA